MRRILFFDDYISQKQELKKSTGTNYKYMYEKHIRDGLGKRKLPDIRYSDIKKFYNTLINEKGFKPNSMEIIHTILHPVLRWRSEMAISEQIQLMV